MTPRHLITLLTLCVIVTFSTAQKVRKTPTPTPKVEAAAAFEYEVVVEESGLASIFVQTPAGQSQLEPEQVKSFAGYRPAPGVSTVFSIRPSAATKFSEIVDVIDALRTAGRSTVRIVVSPNLSVFIPRKFTAEMASKPNPLTLVVEVDEKSELLLNNDPSGTLADTSPLVTRLRKIFRARADNGVYREHSTTVETTVFIKVPGSMTYADLVKLATTLASAGADPIGLSLEDEDNVITVRKALIPINEE